MRRRTPTLPPSLTMGVVLGAGLLHACGGDTCQAPAPPTGELLDEAGRGYGTIEFPGWSDAGEDNTDVPVGDPAYLWQVGVLFHFPDGDCAPEFGGITFSCGSNIVELRDGGASIVEAPWM